MNKSKFADALSIILRQLCFISRPMIIAKLNNRKLSLERKCTIDTISGVQNICNLFFQL